MMLLVHEVFCLCRSRTAQAACRIFILYIVFKMYFELELCKQICKNTNRRQLHARTPTDLHGPHPDTPTMNKYTLD